MANTISTQIRKWRSYRRTYAELMALSDRELTDLGFSRFDIQRIARQSVR